MWAFIEEWSMINAELVAVFPPASLGNPAEIFRQHALSALVCSGASKQTAAGLSAGGVILYSGVVGSIDNAIRLYILFVRKRASRLFLRSLLIL